MIGRTLESLVNHRRILKRAAFVVLFALVVLDILTPSHYERFPWEGIGGFGAIYGFGACVLIIVVSKALGYAMLYRPEDYYDD